MNETRVPTVMEPRYGFDCPSCGKYRFSLLADFHPHRDCGPWYCDACGLGWFVRWEGPEGEVVVRRADRVERTSVILRCTEPFTLVVEGLRFRREDEPTSDEEYAEQEEYFYNLGTCPTNILRKVEKLVTDDGDTDPHGIFTYVGPAQGGNEVKTEETLGREG